MYQNYTKTMRSEVDLKDPGENLEGTGEVLRDRIRSGVLKTHRQPVLPELD